MSTALLLAETEPHTLGFLERHLADDGFRVLRESVRRERTRPDLVLLGDATQIEDWTAEAPVIVIGSAGSDAVDRVRAFERGCDDFLPLPFHYEELVARIHAVLRRTSPARPGRRVVGEITLDPATRRVTVGERVVTLAGKEFELLAHLMADPTRVFTKDELLRDVWGYHAQCRTRTLDAHASRLRRKLAAAGAHSAVVNVWGVGYRLLDRLDD
ncbi:MAG: two-component system, OmpR family, response regulator RegX3 [Gaiellaceae bacterium]|jgi:DNA-binding response OmpR family regulator|nr:two-component system, OmpR family, response regulator RegX3 [Gaiellaceae bacterium]